jgi:hypothetical protein
MERLLSLEPPPLYPCGPNINPGKLHGVCWANRIYYEKPDIALECGCMWYNDETDDLCNDPPSAWFGKNPYCSKHIVKIAERVDPYSRYKKRGTGD